MEFRLQAKHKILKGDRTESLAVSEGQQVWGADCSALLRVTEVCSLTSINPSLAMFLLSSLLWITQGWGRGGDGWGRGADTNLQRYLESAPLLPGSGGEMPGARWVMCTSRSGKLKGL